MRMPYATKLELSFRIGVKSGRRSPVKFLNMARYVTSVHVPYDLMTPTTWRSAPTKIID